MNTDQLSQSIQELALQCAAMKQRYEAALALFGAAALENNSQAMDDQRAMVHAVVDMILDNQCQQFMLVRQLHATPPPPPI